MPRLAAIAPTLCSLLLMTACRTDSASAKPGEADAAATPYGAQADNVGEQSIYEVDPEDPYLIFNHTIFDLSPGQPLAPALDRLRRGTLRTGEGNFKVYHIKDKQGEEVGYVMPDPLDESLIGDIYITSDRVVTEQGVRVGYTYGELVERLGALEVHGSEIEGSTSADYKRLRFMLDEQHFAYELGQEQVSPSAKVTEIVLMRAVPTGM